MAISQSQLRNIQTRKGQISRRLQERAKLIQRDKEKLAELGAIKEIQDTKTQDLYVGAKMALSGKGEQGASVQAKKYEEAIRYPWSPAYQSLSPEEKKVVSQLNEQLRAGATEAKQTKKALEGLKAVTGKESITKVKFTSEGVVFPTYYTNIKPNIPKKTYADPRGLIPEGRIVVDKSGNVRSIITKKPAPIDIVPAGDIRKRVQILEGKYNLEIPIKTEKKGIIEAVKDVYNKGNLFVKEKITQPAYEFVEKGFKKITGSKVSPFSKEYQTIMAPSLIGFGNIPISFGSKKLEVIQEQFKEGGAGISQGIIEDIRDEPLKNIALWGAGSILGAGVPMVISGAGKISPQIGNLVSKGIGALGVGGGIYFIGATGKNVLESKSSYEASKKLGVASKDVLILAAGSKFGRNIYNKISGWWNTRGRIYLNVEQGKYPQLPRKKQLKSFQENIIKELDKEKAGAFHTTGEKFWKDEISPAEGSSELKGLYGSTKVSETFARIQGADSGYSPFGSLTGAKKPAIAYLVPDKFRSVVYELAKNPFFEGQKAIKIKGINYYANIVNVPITGVADVPLMKTEIEAIFRPESGAYQFQSGKYYTLINGVKVPIDVFKPASLSTNTISLNTKGLNLYGGAGSYNLPSSSSPIVSESTGLLSIKGTLSNYGQVSAMQQKLISYSKNIPSSNVLISPKPSSLINRLFKKSSSSGKLIKSFKSPPITTKPKLPIIPSSNKSKPKPKRDLLLTLIKRKKSTKKQAIFRPIVASAYWAGSELKKQKPPEEIIEIFKKKSGRKLEKGKEFEKVGEKLGVGRASKELMKKLFSSLSATGYLKSKKTGQIIPFEKYKKFLPEIFRAGKGKRNQKFTIQRKEKVGIYTGRLASRGERKQIQVLKKSVKKKKNKFKWF